MLNYFDMSLPGTLVDVTSNSKTVLRHTRGRSIYILEALMDVS